MPFNCDQVTCSVLSPRSLVIYYCPAMIVTQVTLNKVGRSFSRIPVGKSCINLLMCSLRLKLSGGPASSSTDTVNHSMHTNIITRVIKPVATGCSLLFTSQSPELMLGFSITQTSFIFDSSSMIFLNGPNSRLYPNAFCTDIYIL